MGASHTKLIYDERRDNWYEIISPEEYENIKKNIGSPIFDPGPGNNAKDDVKNTIDSYDINALAKSRPIRNFNNMK